MKIRYNLLLSIGTMLAVVLIGEKASAQQYKVQQTTTMAGMKSETTIYVKGMRKRTEGGGYTGMPNNPITIEQCDLQRTITINDKKKLYFVEPFSKDGEEVVEEEERSSTKNVPVAVHAKTSMRKGGIVTMWYNITDTGERKKMYGLTARRIWTTQKIKPSADACMMKDSMIIKTDGWYIDLPQFNCPVRYGGTNSVKQGTNQLDCKDRFITRRSGKGKLGFPLIEKKTMIMGNGEASQFETSLQTIEFSTAKLDSMLFEIPAGYALAQSIEDLQDKMDAASLMEKYGNKNKEAVIKQVNPEGPKTAGAIRIGVLEPGGNEQLQTPELQEYLVSTLTADKIEAVTIASVEEAKKYNCDLVLETNFTKVKAAGKIGGFLKAIKNADPSAASSYTIETQLLLSNVPDGTTRFEKRIAGKFEGTADGAAKKALEEGSAALLKELN